MFVEAIEQAAAYTRPTHSIIRYYGSNTVHPAAATLFFVNSDGWALTCAHVARQLSSANQLHDKFSAFKNERDNILGKKKEKKLLKDLERKYAFNNNSMIEIKNRFMHCVDGPLNLEVFIHQDVDLALLKFNDFTHLLCTSFPVFVRDHTNLKQGKYLCRMGFPFPEFSNFEFDANSDSIQWTTTGRTETPRFPIEGMVTRKLLGAGGSILGFELSTPGLRGQSGGPAFDTEGRVWGMQAATAHLDLNFDVDIEVIRDGNKRRVRESAFLHVGHCVHTGVIKEFLREKSVQFHEA